MKEEKKEEKNGLAMLLEKLLSNTEGGITQLFGGITNPMLAKNLGGFGAVGGMLPNLVANILKKKGRNSDDETENERDENENDDENENSFQDVKPEDKKENPKGFSVTSVEEIGNEDSDENGNEKLEEVLKKLMKKKNKLSLL